MGIVVRLLVCAHLSVGAVLFGGAAVLHELGCDIVELLIFTGDLFIPALMLLVLVLLLRPLIETSVSRLVELLRLRAERD